MSKKVKLNRFYSLVDSFGMRLAELGEGLQDWALHKLGHENLADAYSFVPIVPEETARKIFKALETEESLEHDNHLKAVALLQEAIGLMDLYIIQKRETGELFLDDDVENELGIEYEEVVSSLYDHLLSEKKYEEAIELCNKMLKVDLGFPESAEYWGRNLSNAKRQSEPKTGRNDPCPCGSGKKYKKCCLDKADITKSSGAEFSL